MKNKATSSYPARPSMWTPANGRRPLNSGGMFGMLMLVCCTLGFWGTGLSGLQAQCNPTGNPSRYEYDINPTGSFNLMAQGFCISQDSANGCCGAPSSYACVDVIFNLTNGPNGEVFTPDCSGSLEMLTEQGNFDALFFDVGMPDPNGNSVDCNTPINIGNNHMINVYLNGNGGGQIEVTLLVIDMMGDTIYTHMEVTTAGNSIWLTICKPGFGCTVGDFVFGCCTVDAEIALAPMASDTICAGDTTALKITASGGVPPYTAMVRQATATDTTILNLVIPDDNDGDPTMDMATFEFSPLVTTEYSLISINDATDCAKPADGSVTITVNPTPDVDPVNDQLLCDGDPTDPIVFTGSVAGTVFNWTNDNTSIGLAASGTGTIASFTAINTTNAPVTATLIVTPSYTAGGATCLGVPDTFTLTVNPTPDVDPVDDQTVCNGDMTDAVVFAGSVTGTVFDWTNDNTSIGLAASGSGAIGAFTAVNTTNAPVTATITVMPSYTNGGVTCTGDPEIFTITVNPTPDVDPVDDQTVCNGDMTDAVVFAGSVAGTVFNWTNDNTTIGLAASGTGNIDPFAAVNNTNAPVTATITVTPSYTNDGVTCTGAPETFTITVDPTPGVDPVPSQVVCNGDLTAAINFTGPVMGTTFDWTNDNPGIGLPAAGAGNISPFIAINNGTIPVIATITVTPSSSGSNGPCDGAPILFTITVNPTPDVDPVADQVQCNGDLTDPVIFTGLVAGTVFDWTNDNPAIGLAAIGTGNIDPFAAINNTNAPVTATITVTPSYTNDGVTCTGAPETFTITVNPTPDVDPVPDQVVCNGDMTAAINFSGPVMGTTFSWTNDNPGIGLAASGTGNIAPFTAINTGTAPVVATITVTPSATNLDIDCAGNPVTFTITVNPTPDVDPVVDQTWCAGDAVPAIVFTGNVPGSVFSWSRSNEPIGAALNGMDQVPGFIATNNTNAPLSSVFTVVPSFTANGLTCTGAAENFTITVNPVPTVEDVNDQIWCAGDAVPATPFSGDVPGTTFIWSRTAEPVGAPLNGVDAVPAYVAANPTTAPITSTFTVTPEFTNNGITCTGDPTTFTVTVNPQPDVDAVPDQDVCASTATNPVSFSGNVPGTVFNWTNDNTSIGLGASGTGDIAAFIAVNNTNVIQVATITVTPVYSNGGVDCSGTSEIFTITVYPPFSVNVGADQVICQNQSANLNAQFSGGAGSGTWSGGAGVFANPNAAVTTYTPDPTEYGSTIVLIFTSNDPAGPCPADADTLNLTINTLPVVDAGPDKSICPGDNFDLSLHPASILPNGSGVSTGTWSSSGTGIFLPSNAFPGAQTYVPSQADYNAGFVVLTLTSADPVGPCNPVSDQMVLSFMGNVTMACNDLVIIALDEDGMVEVTPDMILEGTYDYDMFTVTLFKNGVPIGNKVDCSHIGMTLMVRVTEICSGNVCMGLVQVEDNLDPTVECADITLPCAETNFTPAYLDQVLGFSQAYPVADDNCTIVSRTHFDTWVSLPCNGSFNGQDDLSGYVVRVWTVVDQSGNSASCTQYIYFQRYHVDDVQLPADVTMECSSPTTDPAQSGTPYLEALGQQYSLYPDDGYCNLQITYEDQVLPTCDGTYNILRKWTIYDACLPAGQQNPLYHTQVIVVEDTTGPVVQCPADITVNTNPIDCMADFDLPDVLIEDACSRIASIQAVFTVNGIPQVVQGFLTTFPGNNLWTPDTLGVLGIANNLNPGDNLIQYIVTDDCGNSSTCAFVVTVDDLTPPVPACDEITQVTLGVNGMALINAETFDDGSYDNCSDVYFKARRMDANSCQETDQFFDQVKFCCEDVGDTIQVILRVYDVVLPAGPVDLDFEEENSNECMVQVYVDDKLKPVCMAPSNVTVSCENFDPSLWAYGAAQGFDNCCVDTVTESSNYALFDTVCNRGTIVRTFRVFDCQGASTQCTQRVVVDYEQDYYIRFPDDLVINECDGTGDFGEPELFGEDCELLAVSYTDAVFNVVPDACYKVERTWTVVNWCTYDPNLGFVQVPNPNPNAITNHPSNLPGPTVSAPGTPAPWSPTVVKVNPTDPQPTDYSGFWSANANGYKYKQIIKVTDNLPPTADNCPTDPVDYCDITPNDPQLWNAPYWFDPLMGSNDLCEGAADLSITATDACSGSFINISYLLFLDFDGNGSMETVVNSNNLPGTNTVYFDNAGNPNFGGGQARAFDQRPVPLNQKFGFAIETEVNGFSKTAHVRWNTASAPATYQAPQLPYGTHKIKWILSDGCGNESVCEYTFVVKDCAAPGIVCLHGLSVNIGPSGDITLFASDFLQFASDNCTPTNQLIFGIVESDEATGGFPYNQFGQEQISVSFDCSELGSQAVQLWARDKQGNEDFCETYVIIQDNMGNCANNPVSVAGALKTESQDGLEDASIELNGIHPALPPVSMFDLSDPVGQYLFPNALPLAANYTVTPLKDDNHLNGVTTWDLVLISKHILGLEPLASPYKMIAADANKSNSITTFDIVELRKLILGIYNELPNNTSWRFVDKSFVFADPANPFAAQFPEFKSVADVQQSQMDDDFVSIKVGDMNGSAIASTLMSADDRTRGTLLFDVEDREVRAGETFTVQLRAAAEVAGYQFTLNTGSLELLDILPGADMTADNFGVFAGLSGSDGAITTSFDGAARGEFSLKVRAKADGRISDMIGVSSRITKAEAYGSEGRMDVALRFNGTTIAGVGFELYQNVPNPVMNKTAIGFHLPEAAEATLTVYDQTGRLLHSQTGQFSKGHNQVTLDRTLLGNPADNLLYYKLETAHDSAVRKMLLFR